MSIQPKFSLLIPFTLILQHIFVEKLLANTTEEGLELSLLFAFLQDPHFSSPFNLMKDSSLKIGFETREYYYYNQPKQALAKDRECLMFPFYHAQTFYEYFISTRLTSYQMESYFPTCSSV